MSNCKKCKHCVYVARDYVGSGNKLITCDSTYIDTQDGTQNCKTARRKEMTDKEKQIQEMAKELHCATNESFISCRKIARILVERRGYRLCGGEDCPNFKHYQAECKRCTKKMEVKKSFEIESAVQQAVKEFAEKLKEKMELNGYRSLLHNRIIDNLITELYGADE